MSNTLGFNYLITFAYQKYMAIVILIDKPIKSNINSWFDEVFGDILFSSVEELAETFLAKDNTGAEYENTRKNYCENKRSDFLKYFYENNVPERELLEPLCSRGIGMSIVWEKDKAQLKLNYIVNGDNTLTPNILGYMYLDNSNYKVLTAKEFLNGIAKSSGIRDRASKTVNLTYYDEAIF